jgi:hypothetical protein
VNAGILLAAYPVWQVCLVQRTKSALGTRVLTHGWEYIEEGIANYEQKLRNIQFKALTKLAHNLNYDLVPQSS